MEKSEISISSNGNKDFQVVIGNVCVTDAFKTKDDAYKDYIKRLIDVVDSIKTEVYKVKTY